MTPHSIALELGSKTYQGDPCKKGHIGIRYTADRHCVDCSAKGGNPISQRFIAQQNNLPTYIGKPCHKCGCTTRLTRDKRCANKCLQMRSSEIRRRRREEGKDTRQKRYMSEDGWAKLSPNFSQQDLSLPNWM